MCIRDRALTGTVVGTVVVVVVVVVVVGSVVVGCAVVVDGVGGLVVGGGIVGGKVSFNGASNILLPTFAPFFNVVVTVSNCLCKK